MCVAVCVGVCVCVFNNRIIMLECKNENDLMNKVNYKFELLFYFIFGYSHTPTHTHNLVLCR